MYIVILSRSLQFCKTLKNVLDVKNVFIQLRATRCFMFLKVKVLKPELTSHVCLQAG